jgi:hypothetical protein
MCLQSSGGYGAAEVGVAGGRAAADKKGHLSLSQKMGKRSKHNAKERFLTKKYHMIEH